jgi:CO dehydrogenase maturation factor
MAKNYAITIIDCEAGIEQINRRVISSISTLITVSDATLKGLRTAVYLKEIASKYGLTGCYRTGLVINRVGKGASAFEERAREMGLDLLGLIPSDENVADYDRLGRPTMDLPDDSPSVLAVRHILTGLGMAS